MRCMTTYYIHLIYKYELHNIPNFRNGQGIIKENQLHLPLMINKKFVKW